MIAGVRPTGPQARAAGRRPALPRLRATLEVVERLGSESHVIFAVDAPRLDGRGGRRGRRGDRGGRRDAARRRQPRALHGARSRGARRFAPGEWSSSRVAAGRGAPVRSRRRATRCGERSRRSPACSGTRRRRGRAARSTESAHRLWRLAYAYRRLHALAVDALPRTPEWEVKCALGLRIWLDAEHAAALERRVERAAPPVGRRRQRAGRAALARGVRRARARARHAASCSPAGDLVVRGALARRAARPTSTTANPLADHPSVRLVEAALRDEERARRVEPRGRGRACRRRGDWPATVAALLAAAGGLLGDDARGRRRRRPLRSRRRPAGRSTAPCGATRASSTRSTSRR